jgi:hypothetical protein
MGESGSFRISSQAREPQLFKQINPSRRCPEGRHNYAIVSPLRGLVLFRLATQGLRPGLLSNAPLVRRHHSFGLMMTVAALWSSNFSSLLFSSTRTVT